MLDPERAIADFTEGHFVLKPGSSRGYFARAIAHRRNENLPAALSSDAAAAIERDFPNPIPLTIFAPRSFINSAAYPRSDCRSYGVPRRSTQINAGTLNFPPPGFVRPCPLDELPAMPGSPCAMRPAPCETHRVTNWRATSTRSPRRMPRPGSSDEARPLAEEKADPRWCRRISNSTTKSAASLYQSGTAYRDREGERD